ncbi:MAG: hypothetical protein HC767_05255 [Akkermansiaceae bacterium]|nr:hypothetical protein [Akkermansiaceae bacterium]
MHVLRILQVFHQDGIDQDSSCKTLEGCLQLLKQWSDSNPDHYPVFLRLDGKDKTTIEFIDEASSTAAGVLRFALNWFGPVRFYAHAALSYSVLLIQTKSGFPSVPDLLRACFSIHDRGT